MKKFAAILMAILLCAAASAQAQTKKPVAKKRPATTTASRVTQDAAKDPGVWLWRYYGADPLVPENMIQKPCGVDGPVMDDTNIANIVTRAAGCERANEMIREGLGLVLFGDPSVMTYHADKPEHPLWAEFERQIRLGNYEWKIYEDGHQFAYKMASGAHRKDGTVVSHLSHAPAKNATGHTVRAIAPKTPIAYKGAAILPLIFENCRNVDAEDAILPPQPAVVVPPVVQAPPAFVVPKELPPLAPVPVVVEEHKRHFSCGPAKVYCWGPAVAAAGILAATHHHGGSKENPPPDTVGKVPYPLPPR